MTSDRADEFIVMGASLDTGNLGVSALLASTVQCLRLAFPEARIWLFRGSTVSNTTNCAPGGRSSC